jgi:hypothetical protein
MLECKSDRVVFVGVVDFNKVKEFTMSDVLSTGFANSVEAQGALSALASNLVKVIHGTADGSYPLGGHTVSAARSTFAQTHNIPSDAVAFVNGIQVGEDHILNANESLEFIKAAGVKG